MTVKKARIIFASHMQAARTRQLTSYEKSQLDTARQVLRQSRKPAMNSKRLDVGTMVVHKRTKDKGFIKSVSPTTGYYRVKWDDGEDSVVTRSAIHPLMDRSRSPKRLPNTPKRKVCGPRKNAPGVLIYGKVIRIVAMKTQNHICDAECKKHGHRYFHDFTSSPKMYGLSDGSLLIK